MASCVLEISLAECDRGSPDPAAYLPGEPMNITVKVVVDEDTTCNQLELVCRTRGECKGFSPDFEGWREQLFQGEWTAGTHVYSCQLLAPSSPPTFNGSWIKCAWWLEVRADLVGQSDARGEGVFVLRASPRSELLLPPPQDDSDRVRESAPPGESIASPGPRSGVVGLSLFAVAIVMAISGVVPAFVWGLPLVVGPVLAGPLVYKHVSAALKRRGGARAAPVELAVALHHVGPEAGYREAPTGEAISCLVYLDPALQVDKIVASLVVREFAEWSVGSGERRRGDFFGVTRHRHGVELTATETPGQWRGLLRLPDQPTPCSIEDAAGRGLLCEVRISVAHSGAAKPAESVVRRIRQRHAGGQAAVASNLAL